MRARSLNRGSRRGCGPSTRRSLSVWRTTCTPARGSACLLAGTGLLMLIAWVDVALLLLATMVDRQREMALRAALGAGWPRLLVRQVLVEIAMLATAGALRGVAMASALLPVIRGSRSGVDSRGADVSLDEATLPEQHGFGDTDHDRVAPIPSAGETSAAVVRTGVAVGNLTATTIASNRCQCASCSLRPQRDRRIHAQGPACRQPDGGDGSRHQDHQHHDIGNRIPRAEAVEAAAQSHSQYLRGE